MNHPFSPDELADLKADNAECLNALEKEYANATQQLFDTQNALYRLGIRDVKLATPVRLHGEDPLSKKPFVLHCVAVVQVASGNILLCGAGRSQNRFLDTVDYRQHADLQAAILAAIEKS